MSKQYCYDIVSEGKEDFDEKELEAFVKNLYIGEDKFEDEEKLPFIIISTDTKICIMLKGRGKKNLEIIENIHNSLKKKDLKFSSSIRLKNPVLFDIKGVNWWEGGVGVEKGNTKWNTLTHNGPYFTHIMEPYEYMNASLSYNGVLYKLEPEEEEIASFYAKRLMSESKGDIVENLTKDKIFNTNFWNDFKTYLTPKHKGIFKIFSKIGWENIIQKLEEKKAISEKEKIKRKINLEKKKHKYGIAVIDGNEEKIGNFVVEPSAIFYGRGKNPNRGKIKGHINPEDVIINVGENDPIPKPPKGHSWKEVVHDNTAVWLSKWTDTITGNTKYVMCSMEGRFKGENDVEKYEKARKLEKYIDLVRERYTRDIDSDVMSKKQLGTILWLIDNHGIRVGNEKGEDETDTVGASTLRVEHIKFKEGHLIFDFLGKDSVHFYKKIKVPKNVFNNVKLFVKGKNSDDQVFDKVSSTNINSYLKTFDKSFSAKVFRTRLASTIMFQELKKTKIPENATKIAIKKSFNKANSQVATVLNHTRNVSQKAKDSVQKDIQKVKELERELQKNDDIKIQNQIQKLKDKIEAKTDVLKVAINTSLNNYIDPRLVVSWSKKNDVEISVIYPQTLMKKFNWAISTTDKKWNYLTSPLVIKSELEPVGSSPKKSNPSKKKSPTPQKKKSPTPQKSSSPTETYIEFANKYRPKVILKYPNMTPLEITKELAKQWKLYQSFNNMSMDELKVQAVKYGCNIANYF